MIEVKCINNVGMLGILTKGKIYKAYREYGIEGKRYYIIENDRGNHCNYFIERFEKVAEYKVDLL